jgi:hypothetical protein
MEFLMYLTPIGREIVSNLAKNKIRIQENTSICRQYQQIFGYAVEKKLAICTNNIKNTISPVNFYVNETVYHEAVHIAQHCKGGSIGIRNPQMEARKFADVKESTKYNPGNYSREVEAYYLEDKPAEVLSYLKKYCF